MTRGDALRRMLTVLNEIDAANLQAPEQTIGALHQWSALLASIKEQSAPWRHERDQLENAFPGLTVEADAERGRK